MNHSCGLDFSNNKDFHYGQLNGISAQLWVCLATDHMIIGMCICIYTVLCSTRPVQATRYGLFSWTNTVRSGQAAWNFPYRYVACLWHFLSFVSYYGSIVVLDWIVCSVPVFSKCRMLIYDDVPATSRKLDSPQTFNFFKRRPKSREFMIWYIC